MADPVPAPTVDLDAIRARADAATPGPWAWSPEIDDGSWNDLGPNLETVARGPVYQDGSQGAEVDVISAWGHDAWGINVNPADASFIAAARTDVPALVAELSVLRAREAQVRELCEPKPAKQDDQCRNCGDRRLHHRPGTCGLCGFCDGFATRLPLIAADRLLAVLDGTTGSGKTG